MRGAGEPGAPSPEAKLFRARRIPVAYTLPQYNKRLAMAASPSARGLMDTWSNPGDPARPTQPGPAPAKRTA